MEESGGIIASVISLSVIVTKSGMPARGDMRRLFNIGWGGRGQTFDNRRTDWCRTPGRVPCLGLVVAYIRSTRRP